VKRSEGEVKFGQQSKKSHWIRLNGTHIIIEWLTESEDHIHIPGQLNCWCLYGVWP
jgi:hypothetical protein